MTPLTVGASAAHRCVVVFQLDVMPQLRLVTPQLGRNGLPLCAARITARLRSPWDLDLRTAERESGVEDEQGQRDGGGEGGTFQSLPDGSLALVGDPFCTLQRLPV